MHAKGKLPQDIKHTMLEKAVQLCQPLAAKKEMALQYVCFILNRTAHQKLKWRTPLELWSGSTPDISMVLLFIFYERVYYQRVETSFPSDSRENIGRFAGFSEYVGHQMTFKVVTPDNKIIHRSMIRKAGTSDSAIVQELILTTVSFKI